jgi:hypothetical protein
MRVSLFFLSRSALTSWQDSHPPFLPLHVGVQLQDLPCSKATTAVCAGPCYKMECNCLNVKEACKELTEMVRRGLVICVCNRHFTDGCFSIAGLFLVLGSRLACCDAIIAVLMTS